MEENISDRVSSAHVIEARMLRSIQNCLALSGLSEQEVNGAEKVPDFATMCRDLGIGGLFYAASQRMGSHAVYGTWSDLVVNYLSHEDDQGLSLRGHEVDTQNVQYNSVSRPILAAIASFQNYVAAEPSEIKGFISVLEGIERNIVELQDLAWPSDSNKV